MWLITTVGFFSIVQKPWDQASGNLTVRARVRQDLDELRKRYLPGLGEIKTDPDADYLHRAQVSRAELATALGRMVSDLDYDNFKNAVAKHQGAGRAHIYHDVWSALYQLQKWG